jgi:alpha-D-ribose 1-methylphosphonate 5-triphosphate diphosphatase
MEPLLHADNRIHIRWETFALDEIAEVEALFMRRKRPILAFNDHTTPTIAGTRKELKIRGSAERAMVDMETYSQLLAAAEERQREVPAAIARLAEVASSHDIPMLSHDDCSPEIRQYYRSLGVKVAEFPLDLKTLAEAAAAGDDIVLGSPNVVRGGSHNGAIAAEDAIRNRSCSILASDYYYPAPLNAALGLAERNTLPMERAWELVSAAPAMACGLVDRGRIVEGLRADLVVLPEMGLRPLSVIVEGRVVYDCS